jgi:hypothetical protein
MHHPRQKQSKQQDRQRHPNPHPRPAQNRRQYHQHHQKQKPKISHSQVRSLTGFHPPRPFGEPRLVLRLRIDHLRRTTIIPRACLHLSYQTTFLQTLQ